MYIVKSKWIILDSENVLENGIILVDNGLIKGIYSEISQIKNFDNIQIYDYKDSIIMPSFTNAHIHMYGILSWGIPKLDNFDDFEGFLKVFWWPLIEDRLRKKEILITTEASCLDLINSGITGFCDSVEAPLTEEDTLFKQSEIIDKYGLKGILSLESSERIDMKNGILCLEQNRNFIKQNRNKNIRGCICTHTTFTCSGEFIKKAKNIANEENTFLQFHLSESIYEKNYTLNKFKLSPIEYLNKLGVLDKNTLMSQCVKVDSKEIDIIKENNCKVVHNPISNCEVGGGFSPVQEMLSKGIDVALGTDGYVNDFFEVMRFAFLIHKANMENTEVMNAKTVFKMATENGAKALGFNHGKIQENYDADFIILNNKFSTTINKNNIYDLVVVKGEKEMIEDIFINGKIFKRSNIVYEKNKMAKETKKLSNKFWEGIK